MPSRNTAAPAINKRFTCSGKNRGAQLSQNLRLVQKYQCRRMIFALHSAQNFGRYMVKFSGKGSVSGNDRFYKRGLSNLEGY